MTVGITQLLRDRLAITNAIRKAEDQAMNEGKTPQLNSETAMDILERLQKVCDAGGEHESYHSFEKYEVESYTSGSGLMEHEHSSVGLIDDCSGDFIEVAEKIDDEAFAERIATSLNMAPRLLEAVKWQQHIIDQMCLVTPMLAAKNPSEHLRKILTGESESKRKENEDGEDIENEQQAQVRHGHDYDHDTGRNMAGHTNRTQGRPETDSEVGSQAHRR